MTIKYGNKYKNSVKKLKNREKEKKTLEMIINHIKQCKDYSELRTNPFSLMYGYEQLKYGQSDYHSFNLNKKGGKIRLIIKVENEYMVSLEFVSVKHYEDFKNRL